MNKLVDGMREENSSRTPIGRTTRRRDMDKRKTSGGQEENEVEIEQEDNEERAEEKEIKDPKGKKQKRMALRIELRRVASLYRRIPNSCCKLVIFQAH